ncbi:MAG TPA: 23S rRNA pseudouridine(955/2504/2580) synthase RluC [Halieaceae bacterium]|jgi:23S rRNA pseudouridine955/2504/2580 synthase|uniref:23S rRNA pseudouridine(955/2504/2580) synthase RluC n=1 Tax=Haliea TaxID=475794 RepID=UPI000429EC04|nr:MULTISPECIES: 23S rRNA pseudouridine(955/2504/2580) synthase RluC [Haliea]MAD64421.1 23S rRNA pseudouridine(955/2504/2580) synthase RluC [Haliea sp.]MAY91699.1 23S rRNA pseudouridine(955/2504/2580) synthase RluC [Haliea sp.]MBP70425.1 23S rRNA pseudouridine(955/2504/2580) synthase RluC [Haliea sp.]HBQ41302.1 23S rRNA pseudouridine(955/2504/2580) synthase RluC [Halieaceae bacterium]|tara:strand:- start:11078 stop:12034 length:957 start_codon:yes stop_codon:yes gene_type:complete
MVKPRSTGTPNAVRFVEIDADSAGQRLDNYLLRELKGVPKTRIYRGLRKGEFRINKGRVKAEYRLVAGDLLRVPPLHQPEPGAAPVVPGYWAGEIRARIVYEDPGLLVINKPSGLAVHGGSGLNFGLIECLRQLRPDDRYLELVHRLDRDTSGLILVARKPAVLRELHRQLRGDGVDKRYVALVAGRWPRERRMVEAPLQKNVVQSGERMVRVAKEGKASVTGFQVLEQFPAATLVEARPFTGRTHQIRVHARFAGHPILGDDKYMDDACAALARSLGVGRLFLHARSLAFTLPGEAQLRLEAPLDAELELILENARK